jgi:MFS family permease
MVARSVRSAGAREPAKAASFWIVAGLVGSAFTAQLGGNALNVALPQLAQTFHASSVQVQSVVVIYLAAMTAALCVVGPIGDRLGRRRVLIAGLAIFGAGSLLGAFAADLPVLIAARALQGLGGAAMAAMSMAIVLDALPRTQAGATLGVLSTASASATMLAPSVGGIMVAAFGWRSMMLLNLPLIAAALAIVMRALTDAAKSATSAPFFDPVLLRNHRITAGLATSMLVAMVMATTLTIGPFVLAGQMRLPFAEIGFVMACGPLVSVLLAVRAGQLADRIGAHRTTIGALALFTAGGALLASVVGGHSVVAYTCSIVVLSIGYAMFQTPNSAAVMAEAPPECRATVSGLLTLVRNLGFIAGTVGIGALFTATNATGAFSAVAVLGACALGIAALAREEA